MVSVHGRYYCIYTIICLKSVGVRKLQVTILARSPREMSQTDRIHEFASQFGLEFFIREKTPNQTRPHVIYFKSLDPLCGQINNCIGNCRTDPAGWRRANVSGYCGVQGSEFKPHAGNNIFFTFIVCD